MEPTGEVRFKGLTMAWDPERTWVATYKGRAVTELTRAELIEAYTTLARACERERQLARAEREVEAEFERTRTALGSR